MPYNIRKQDNKWCVFNKETGENKGCSNSEEMAKKHMSALYAAENKSLVKFSMAITKASIPNKRDRTMRIRMVNSDTGEDAYEERMSIELFNDFVERIEDNAPIPEPFDVLGEDGWNGGMPYLSISHYKSGAGRNVPGEPEKVYVDGERLKSSAILYENPLGLAVWKSINTDLEERNKPINERTYKYPVRISIGFLDFQHKHELEGEEDYVFTRSELKQKCPKCEEGINGKVYLKGQLVHLAFTRVPANPRTQVEVFKMSDEIETEQDDARSIVGDFADELVGKSVVKDSTLVVKTEHDDEENESRDQKKKKKDEEEMDKSQTSENLEVDMEENTQVQEPVEEKNPVVEEEVEEIPVKSSVEKTVANLMEKFAAVKSRTANKDELQPILNELVKNLNEETVDPVEKALTGLEERMEAMFDRKLGEMKVEITQEVLKSLPMASEKSKQEVPTPRSILVNRNNVPAQGQEEMSQIRKIALRSMGQQV